MFPLRPASFDIQREQSVASTDVDGLPTNEGCRIRIDTALASFSPQFGPVSRIVDDECGRSRNENSTIGDERFLIRGLWNLDPPSFGNTIDGSFSVGDCTRITSVTAETRLFAVRAVNMSIGVRRLVRPWLGWVVGNRRTPGYGSNRTKREEPSSGGHIFGVGVRRNKFSLPQERLQTAGFQSLLQ